MFSSLIFQAHGVSDGVHELFRGRGKHCIGVCSGRARQRSWFQRIFYVVSTPARPRSQTSPVPAKNVGERVRWNHIGHHHHWNGEAHGLHPRYDGRRVEAIVTGGERCVSETPGRRGAPSSRRVCLREHPRTCWREGRSDQGTSWAGVSEKPHQQLLQLLDHSPHQWTSFWESRALMWSSLVFAIVFLIVFGLCDRLWSLWSSLDFVIVFGLCDRRSSLFFNFKKSHLFLVSIFWSFLKIYSRVLSFIQHGHNMAEVFYTCRQYSDY